MEPEALFRMRTTGTTGESAALCWLCCAGMCSLQLLRAGAAAGGAPHDVLEAHCQEHLWPDCRSCASADTSPAALTSAVTCAPSPPHLPACPVGTKQACMPSPCSVPVEQPAAHRPRRLPACPVRMEQALMHSPCRVRVDSPPPTMVGAGASALGRRLSEP